MDGKVIVVTGALGALGKIVAEVTLARGARVAGVDYGTSQIAATPDRIEFGAHHPFQVITGRRLID